jgi:hypothetical protein
VTIHYEMSTGDRMLATGFSRHIYVSREMQRTRLPEKYWRHFGIAPVAR